MSETYPRRPFVRGAALSGDDAANVRRWHVQWLALLAGSGALLTVILGSAPAATYAAFVGMAVTALLGLVLYKAARSLMVLWAIAVAFALSAAGGMTGSGAPWILTLFAAALLLRRPMLEAAILAGLTLIFAVAAELSKVAADQPADLHKGVLTALSLATTAWALATAAVMRREDSSEAVVLAPQPALAAEPAPTAEPVPAPAAAAEPAPELLARIAAAEEARDEALAARAQAEEGRKEAQAANAAKSRFLANMSHELRTPLNAVMGFADIMRNRLFGPLPERYAEYAQLIHESGAHLLELINDVLDMSKIEADSFKLSREVFDAREAITAVLRLMRPQADEAGISLRGVLPEEAVTVEADKRALKQIALNLLSNALKFTPREGSVAVTMTQADGVLELTVSDTGVGVAPEDLERLGRPYEQAGDADSRAQGTGLGLSLVRAFAGLHGGEMSIESRLGEGTAVTVRLPVVVETQAGEPPAGGEVIPFSAR